LAAHASFSLLYFPIQDRQITVIDHIWMSILILVQLLVILNPGLESLI